VCAHLCSANHGPPTQNATSEQNIEDLSLYLRRWNDFLQDSKKSISELDRIWGFWIDLWLSLTDHVSCKAANQKRSTFVENMFDLIGERVCFRLLSSLAALHMHTSNQNLIVFKARSFICKFWLEQHLKVHFKISGIRKTLFEQLVQNPEFMKDNSFSRCGSKSLSSGHSNEAFSFGGAFSYVVDSYIYPKIVSDSYLKTAKSSRLNVSRCIFRESVSSSCSFGAFSAAGGALFVSALDQNTTVSNCVASFCCVRTGCGATS
jgi:hypothetical protein